MINTVLDISQVTKKEAFNLDQKDKKVVDTIVKSNNGIGNIINNKYIKIEECILMCKNLINDLQREYNSDAISKIDLDVKKEEYNKISTLFDEISIVKVDEKIAQSFEIGEENDIYCYNYDLQHENNKKRKISIDFKDILYYQKGEDNIKDFINSYEEKKELIQYFNKNLPKILYTLGGYTKEEGIYNFNEEAEGNSFDGIMILGRELNEKDGDKIIYLLMNYTAGNMIKAREEGNWAKAQNQLNKFADKIRQKSLRL